MRFEVTNFIQVLIFSFFVRRAGLYCLLSTEEGVILADSINMFYSLALTRLSLTGLEVN